MGIGKKAQNKSAAAVSRPVSLRPLQIDDGSTNICERAVGLILLQLVDHISSARRIIYWQPRTRAQHAADWTKSALSRRLHTHPGVQVP